MGNSGLLSSHLLNLIYNAFTQLTSVSESTRMLAGSQLSPFFACTSSITQNSCHNALNAAITTMITVFRGFLKTYCFSALIHSWSLCEARVNFGSFLKYALSDDIDSI